MGVETTDRVSEAAEALAKIRAQIDRVDDELHRLLIERSGVIEKLIAAKRSGGRRGALRPDREAAMMRRLVARHEGLLPLTTIEHLWREIITTFTAMQAPFSVIVAPGNDPLALRDLTRFYFGFSVPVREAVDAASAIAQVARPGSADVALVPIRDEEPAAWWAALEGEQAAAICARLPFLQAAGRPADLPAYVVAPPVEVRDEMDRLVVSWRAGPLPEGIMTATGASLISRSDDAVLLELPAGVGIDELGDVSAGTVVGRIAAPLEVHGGRPAGDGLR